MSQPPVPPSLAPQPGASQSAASQSPAAESPASRPPVQQHFASDNYAGICPEAFKYFAECNASGHEVAYGDDSWTQRVCDHFRDLFETDCEIFFVFNGTAANSLALASLCQSYQSVICHELSHVETDECGGPEFFSNGSKLLTAKGPLGKLTAEAVDAVVQRRSDIHFPKPKVVTVTQATEVGTVYTVAEIAAIGEVARRHNLRLHMDGARFANAVATLGVRPAELTWRAGVDVLCFGGTKNGLPVGEAVIFFNRALAEDFAYRVKQAGQLASKMRFISAPWLGLLENDVWLSNARHANAMAERLAQRLALIPGVKLLFPRQANSVFAELPVGRAEQMHGLGWKFYEFIGAGGCRLMCAWDTTSETVDRFADALQSLTDAAAK
ncbi:MAG: beta-eliminating lyase-related protein [Janthinobacterium lividum]